jgi:hypothetical protein
MIRTVLISDNNHLTLSIPKEYIGKELEVTVFPIGEISGKSVFSKKVTFNSISIDTRGYQFNREEANER